MCKKLKYNESVIKSIYEFKNVHNIYKNNEQLSTKYSKRYVLRPLLKLLVEFDLRKACNLGISVIPSESDSEAYQPVK